MKIINVQNTILVIDRGMLAQHLDKKVIYFTLFFFK